MAQLKVRFSKKARKQIAAQSLWYSENKGLDFQASFEESVITSVETLRTMPTIGKFERLLKEREVRSFLIHRRCRLVYSYDDKTLYISSLRFNDMLN